MYPRERIPDDIFIACVALLSTDIMTLEAPVCPSVHLHVSEHSVQVLHYNYLKEFDWKFNVDWPTGDWKIYSPNTYYTLFQCHF